MTKDLAQQAIQSALSGNWKEAILINKNILSDSPDDVDALNRLARAFAETGDVDSAKKQAQKVLKLDPFNTIAEKSLNKWKTLKKGETIKSNSATANVFLEEPGKTKIIPLMHLGDQKIIAKLDAGDEVILGTHGHRVSVLTTDNCYIGRLPDDLSIHLKKLISIGNSYKAYIRNCDEKNVRVLLREEKKVKEMADIPSFSSEKIEYISFTPPELVHKGNTSPEIPTDEDSDE